MNALRLVKMDEVSFRFPCPACASIIDAMTAEWCRCLVKRPSAVCPQCQVCLCKAESHINREFWHRAPAPVIERNLAERHLRAERSQVRGKIIDVLVVDDDEEIRTVAAFMIEQMGYRVMTASGAAHVLELLESVAPSLVLTDALMPKIDGRQLCRYVKAGFPDVKVVIMTSLYTSPRYKYEALKTFQADDYVAKPIDFENLTQVVERFVPRKADEVSNAS